ncbi:hypothetical protein GF343_00005 [Candidatus Woesearchaeota archaeon]|nr:hypothetical protein [Candidatus Woesearchaeota archaeon]
MKTWEEIEHVDELVTDEEKKIIGDIESQLTARCPHLKKLGQYFYYCSGGIPEGTELLFTPLNPVISAKQEVIQLQLHCMDRYKACCCYKGTLPFPNKSDFE